MAPAASGATTKAPCLPRPPPPPPPIPGMADVAKLKSSSLEAEPTPSSWAVPPPMPRAEDVAKLQQSSTTLFQDLGDAGAKKDEAAPTDGGKSQSKGGGAPPPMPGASDVAKLREASAAAKEQAQSKAKPAPLGAPPPMPDAADLSKFKAFFMQDEETTKKPAVLQTTPAFSFNFPTQAPDTRSKVWPSWGAGMGQAGTTTIPLETSKPVLWQGFGGGMGLFGTTKAPAEEGASKSNWHSFAAGSPSGATQPASLFNAAGSPSGVAPSASLFNFSSMASNSHKADVAKPAGIQPSPLTFSFNFPTQAPATMSGWGAGLGQAGTTTAPANQAETPKPISWPTFGGGMNLFGTTKAPTVDSFASVATQPASLFNFSSMASNSNKADAAKPAGVEPTSLAFSFNFPTQAPGTESKVAPSWGTGFGQLGTTTAPANQAGALKPIVWQGFGGSVGTTQLPFSFGASSSAGGSLFGFPTQAPTVPAAFSFSAPAAAGIQAGATQPSLWSSSPAPTPSVSQQPLLPGDTIRLKGLVRSADLNGSTAVVVQDFGETVELKLPSGIVKKVKKANVEKAA
eukprot:gnl/TRDRNA2_/TRDRNA2_166550_c0_seq1.p1 gnl/TRDRNA2_/TRDRNA2_166550_c0~~gnl/TRDRNA2_/TRDRNA2_166550_c0_seq1.p1  ORF type:complete len:570 (+),score=72.83 gnl/TRDRNA2_/TRDRNA2_166550_c0_seq1:2-1711(+)